jgi:hypothetical protein
MLKADQDNERLARIFAYGIKCSDSAVGSWPILSSAQLSSIQFRVQGNALFIPSRGGVKPLGRGAHLEGNFRQAAAALAAVANNYTLRGGYFESIVSPFHRVTHVRPSDSL